MHGLEKPSLEERLKNKNCTKFNRPVPTSLSDRYWSLLLAWDSCRSSRDCVVSPNQVSVHENVNIRKK